jgi:hypothetical protein
MLRTAWIASLLVAGTAAAGTSSFLPHPVAPEHGVSILNRASAERLTGRTLLGEPAASAVLGTVHVYAAFPYVEARYVHVTSDARWQRLLYGLQGDAPRAFGRAGDGPGEFREPRGLAFAPDGRLFVADRVLGRVTVLRLSDGAEGPALEYAGQIDGLVQPMDVAVHDGGTPATPGDDRLLIAEAGAQRVALYALHGATPVRLAEFGSPGSAPGEFLYPRAVCVGRVAGVNDAAVYVADSGNHRVVRLQLDGARLHWGDVAQLPLEATSLDSDHFGNVYLALRRHNTIWKMSPRLEHVATYSGGATPLVAPRDVTIPFAWVHDHRRAGSAPAWRGQGSAMVLEAWGPDTGVRRLDLGIEIAAVERRDTGTLEVTLTDAARVHATVVSTQGVTTTADFGVRGAGRQRLQLDGLDGAARVTLVAESQYDAQRRDERALELAALAPARMVLHQNAPNPFNPATTIAFDMPHAGPARLVVFDVRGRAVRTLLDGHVEAGRQQAIWDGRDGAGRRVSSGVYFYRLDAGEANSVRKMVLAQ